ncbi:hypothetical protein Tco_1443827, partial [Tanacetum coccineum]
SKSKIDVESASKAKDKVSSASRIKQRNLRDKPLNTFIKNKIRTSRIWKKWFESQPNVIWTPVSVVQIVLWVVDSDCSKHMTSDRSLLRNSWAPFALKMIILQQSQAMGIIYMAISLFVMYIMLKVLDITSLALDNFVMEIYKWLFVPIHVTYEIWKEMICSQVDANLICILSPFLAWLLLHPFVSCPKQLQQSHGAGTDIKEMEKTKTKQIKPSTEIKRARENESSGALGFYWASP